MKNQLDAGIVDTDVPRYRLRLADVARHWGYDRNARPMPLAEKSVQGEDEDMTSMAIEASRNALEHSGVLPNDLGAVSLGVPYLL